MNDRMYTHANPYILVYHERAAALCAKELHNLGVTNIHIACSEEEVEPLLDQVEIIFCWKFPIRLFAKAPALKWVQLMGAGVDDVVLSRQLPKEVVLTRIIGQFGAAMAEYVFAHVLYQIKHLEMWRTQQQELIWKPKSVPLMRNKTMAIAGIGSIGQEVIRLGRAFGMRVIGLSKTSASAHWVDQHYSTNQWGEFVAKADIIVITLPHTAATQGVFNRKIFDQMKSDVIIVNVGRGAVVNEDDLVHFLQRHEQSVAILDVFNTEPLPKASPLWTMPNVVITPHISGPSSMVDVSVFFYENLQRYVQGDRLHGQVDVEAEY
ncbi:MAG: D-2-hydroxyacid dehydrogenase [Acidibacillus sp.]|nr:D-2-hydroxyacid dehydrogenase [Acidibacillus sp.]